MDRNRCCHPGFDSRAQLIGETHWRRVTVHRNIPYLYQHTISQGKVEVVLCVALQLHGGGIHGEYPEGRVDVAKWSH